MTTYTVTIPDHGPVDLTVEEYGAGRPFLLLHGGAGPRSVVGFAQTLAAREPARVLVPTHPGFNGTARPDWLHTVAGLAQVYAALLDQLDLADVTVIGSSVGGWLAAELAVLSSPHVIGTVLVDAAGIEIADQPVVDVFALTTDQIADLSYHNPEPFRIDVASLPEAQRAAIAANFATLRTYGGAMNDPGLRARLSTIATPTLVVWGDSDGVFTPDYGRAYAAAIPGARFELLPDTGHLPTLESPEALLKLVQSFADAR